MGYRTPNIDRIAREGMLFTDCYAEQSCTAGRSSFITGQSVLRTGSAKVGVPASPIGMNEKIVTIAALLKEQGYATGQFGKNHLGDLNLDAADQPRLRRILRQSLSPECRGRAGDGELSDRRRHPELPRTLRPARRDPQLRERHRRSHRAGALGPVGKQKIEDTGPLTKKRMETCDDDFVEKATAFIKKAQADGKPFFVWLNTTHMHLFTHTKPESKGQAGRWQSDYHDTMIDHDKNVGQMLDLLDELGIADDTVRAIFDRQRAASQLLAGRRHDPVPQREEHQLGRRLPRPDGDPLAGQDRGGSVSNGIVQHHDWMPTFLEMAGALDVIDKLKTGYKAIGRTYKNHIDGYSLLGHITGKEAKSPRNAFFYISDDGDILGMRYDNWKIVFMEQRCQGTLQVWAEPFTRLRSAEGLQPAHRSRTSSRM
jgi:arylsulfatase